tara:strand:+ start:109593 stop:109823 length:231 start_codon:yes stop_codon:yes gene_type:complete
MVAAGSDGGLAAQISSAGFMAGKDSTATPEGFKADAAKLVELGQGRLLSWTNGAITLVSTRLGVSSARSILADFGP